MQCSILTWRFFFQSEMPVVHLQEYSHCYDCERHFAGCDQSYIFLYENAFFPHTVITLRYVDSSVTVAIMSARSWPLFEMGDTYHSRGNCELLLLISLILYFLMVRVWVVLRSVNGVLHFGARPNFFHQCVHTLNPLDKNLRVDTYL